MTREDYTQEILELSDSHKYLMLNLPTGMGKSKVAIDIIKRHTKDKLMGCNVLIVVPKNVLKDNWKEELIKWEFPELINVQFTTYISYPKYAETYWDFIIFDEGHHYTENCADATDLFHYDRVLVLSATIEKEPKWRLKSSFRGIYEYKVSAREAIDNEILPDPKVLMIPMTLNNLNVDQTIVIRKSYKGTPVELSYQNRRARFNYPRKKVIIHCTQQQYYNFITEDIEYKKRDYVMTQVDFKRNLWLHTCKERLDWLAVQKEDYVVNLLKLIDNYRTLTFCTSIAQTKKFGEHPINSENKKESLQNLADFNDGKINHITAAAILNEGMNLKNCQIGIYANIGSSKVVELQRLGRLLRHENPLIIIPYFVGTREEELVNEMTRNYNASKIIKLFKSQVTKEELDNIING